MFKNITKDIVSLWTTSSFFVQHVILNLFIFNISTDSVLSVVTTTDTALSMGLVRPTQKWKYEPTEWNIDQPVKGLNFDFEPPLTPGPVREGEVPIGRDNKAEMDAFLKNTKIPGRTTPEHISAIEPCDYLILHCLRAFQTGQVCGRANGYELYTFKNYCMLDFTNCVMRYRYFQLIHMGPCIMLTPPTGKPPKHYDESSQMQNYVFKDPFPWVIA